MCIFFTACSQTQERVYSRFPTQQRIGYFDTLINFIGYAQDEDEFMQYTEIFFDTLGELHRLFDIFNPYEGVNNLYTINANAGVSPVVVEQPIIDMLQAAIGAYHMTDGMTNVAMGSVLRIWHEHRQRGIAHLDYGTIPYINDLMNASILANIDDIIIDVENSTVFLRTPGMSLDVGAIAKGFATELAMQAAIDAGMPAALVSAGGHVVAHGQPSARETWNVGIQNPDVSVGAPRVIDTVAFTDMTLSISGGYERFFEVDGQHLGHIIDPVTLMPANRFQQVAVLHSSSWMADILSTALFILPLEEGWQMALDNEAEVLWIDIDGEWFATPGYIRISAELGA
ncbi:MAG: FAD:protein FMN transferase [Defluviitaleaceae bacterium]|nr:FAD:protein FMN transferase [Defluviitaleaceae bacterium]